MFRPMILVSLTAGLVVASAGSGQARIQCRQGYQMVQGHELATPYCQDQYLAEVAREYGMKVSAEAVRQNPNLKQEVCRFVGRDIRVQQNCINENSGRGSRF